MLSSCQFVCADVGPKRGAGETGEKGGQAQDMGGRDRFEGVVWTNFPRYIIEGALVLGFTSTNSTTICDCPKAQFKRLDRGLFRNTF